MILTSHLKKCPKKGLALGGGVQNLVHAVLTLPTWLETKSKIVHGQGHEQVWAPFEKKTTIQMRIKPHNLCW